MKVKCGIDSTDIKRIEKSLENEHFKERVFGKSELKELEIRGFPSESAAAAFCAKEAFSKAVGCGLSGIVLKEIELLHEDNGKPYLKISGSCFDKYGGDYEVSITHTDSTATAVVIGISED